MLRLLLLALFGLALPAYGQTACTLDASEFMTAMFGMPSAEVLTQVFSLGVITPLTGYMVAYYVGLLVNFWNR